MLYLGCYFLLFPKATWLAVLQPINMMDKVEFFHHFTVKVGKKSGTCWNVELVCCNSSFVFLPGLHLINTFTVLTENLLLIL